MTWWNDIATSRGSCARHSSGRPIWGKRQRNQWMETCRASNDELCQVNSELLIRYQNNGLFDTLAGAEPITGLARVQKENVVDDYRYRLGDLKMLDFAESSPPPEDDVASASAQP